MLCVDPDPERIRGLKVVETQLLKDQTTQGIPFGPDL